MKNIEESRCHNTLYSKEEKELFNELEKDSGSSMHIITFKYKFDVFEIIFKYASDENKLKLLFMKDSIQKYIS